MRTTVFIICILGACRLQAQSFDFTKDQIDKITLNYYYNENWAGIIDLGERAIKNGVSFDYLHYRLGEAYYANSDYTHALKHFRKILNTFSNDALLQEYYYYCLVFTNRWREAVAFLPACDTGFTNKLDVGNSNVLEAIYVEAGFKFSSLAAAAPNQNIGTIGYRQIGLNSRWSHHLHTYASYATLNQSAYWGSYLQQETNISGAYFLRRGWSLFAAVDIIGLDRTILATPDFPESTEFLIDQSYYGGIAKRWTHLMFEAGGSYSKLYDTPQSQAMFAAHYYPMGNNSLVLSAFGTLHHEADSTTALFKFRLGKQLGEKFWISADYYAGNSRNVIEERGTFVNYSIDATTSRWGLLLSYAPAPKTQLFLNAQYENKWDDALATKYTFSTAIIGFKYFIN
ncbi:hypothetical protein GC194_01010 [bacterium]|nr:hypothetical protein [bacterium]